MTSSADTPTPKARPSSEEGIKAETRGAFSATFLGGERIDDATSTGGNEGAFSPDSLGEEGVDDFSRELEALNGPEKACLDSMKADFNRGNVEIAEDIEGEDSHDEGSNDTEEIRQMKTKTNKYRAVLDVKGKASQTWEAIQHRLLVSEGVLLKKAVELSKLTGDPGGEGVIFIGVHSDGTLAIRQRSSEIVNGRWTEESEDGELNKSELRLLHHPEAIKQEAGQWADAHELADAVKAAGYHLGNKELIAAFEAVTEERYLKSADILNLKTAILAPDPNSRTVPTIFSSEYGRGTFISDISSSGRLEGKGAILWLKG